MFATNYYTGKQQNTANIVFIIFYLHTHTTCATLINANINSQHSNQHKVIHKIHSYF